MKKILLKYKILILLVFLGSVSILLNLTSFTKTGFINQFLFFHSPVETRRIDETSNFFTKLAIQAEERLNHSVVYNGSYYKIDYPNGDVPANIGVCTDVVVRSYRAVGIDLQETVHQDMAQNFLHYPKMWGHTKPDTNIDHRRVPNLMTFFNRSGSSLPVTTQKENYLPGHVVSWNLGGGVMHIGIVSTKKSPKTGNPLIVHNIGSGPQINDMLFNYKIIGHFRHGI